MSSPVDQLVLAREVGAVEVGVEVEEVVEVSLIVFENIQTETSWISAFLSTNVDIQIF